MRQSNEDRVAINYRVEKPSYKICESWPIISYFGLFDGHGGSSCADYLRDNLLNCILKQNDFPEKPIEAIKAGFADAELSFLAFDQNSSASFDRSGSCAIVVLIIKNICYVANVGDSRAVLSSDKGMRFFELSQDHKPNIPTEKRRIEDYGGKVYSNPAYSTSSVPGGPMVVYRVLPGRLAISRTFGDADAKLERLGGLPGVVIAEPEIKSFRLSQKFDFILMASDGVFDRLSNSDVIQTAWRAFNASSRTFHGACGESVKKVLEEALNRHSLDNVTAVLIAFNSLREASMGPSDIV